MPRSALPKKLQDVENNFPDDDQFMHIPIIGPVYRWVNKVTKTWFAFSNRCPEKWAKWRRFPKTLVAIGDRDGVWRYEGKEVYLSRSPKFNTHNRNIYHSRIQYFMNWHIIIQWPFMISISYTPKDKKDPWYFYWNHFDADEVYWMVTSMFIGRGWK